MNKTLASLILAGVATLSSGCSTTPTQLRTPGHIKDVAVSSVSSERDANYRLKTVNIEGLGETAFYENLTDKSDETPYIGKPYFGGSRIRIDLEEKTASLNPAREFVPVKLYEGEGANRRLVTRFNLDTDGPYGFRAQNRNMDIPDKSSPIRLRTQRNLDWDLKPLEIKYADSETGKEVVELAYILGRKNSTTRAVEKVFIMPKIGTILDIDIDSGSGFLENESGYYEVKVMSPQDHAQRNPSESSQTFPINTGNPAQPAEPKK